MKIIPNIKSIYKDFPDDYINDIRGWGIDKETILKNKGKLLTLDIDFGSYCSLNCPGCFRKNNKVDKVKKELDYTDLVRIILEAKKLGLKQVKFLGAGEPQENSRYLEFIRFLKSENVISMQFTKGQVIGDDSKVKHYFGKYGITTGRELVKELYDNDVSITLGFNSFDDKIQGKMVGKNREFIHVRNRALELLVEAGFNRTNPTRLGLGVNPITNWNIDEAFEIYKWGRLRNMYVVVTPTMISGRVGDDSWKYITPPKQKIIDLYEKINKFNISRNLQKLEFILENGVSAYAGGHVCNQVACGLYLTLNGIILRCPGSDTAIEGNVWENSLTEIWNNSKNKNELSGKYNCRCIAKDGKSIPDDLYQKVENSIVSKY
jgi:MoaA/NifB/PqqE/SkfB family radical SAM enzyme